MRVPVPKSTGTQTLVLGEGAKEEAYGLVIAWSASEPHRAGEIAFVGDGQRAQVLGRGDGFAGELERTVFFRQRPGVLLPTTPLVEQGISREQLRLRARSDGIELDRIGRCVCLINGKPENRILVEPGDTVHLKGQLLLYCVKRSLKMSNVRSFPIDWVGPFGEPDSAGIVGESLAAWRLREGIGQIAKSDRHVLIAAEIGSERDLAIRAIHTLSRRSQMPIVSVPGSETPVARLARTLRGGPNEPQSSLVIDEIGDLEEDQIQVLVQALAHTQKRSNPPPGRSSSSSSNAPRYVAPIRILATTSRDPYELHPDLLGKLTPALVIPSLNSRREDVPLIARHLMKQHARKSQTLAARFFDYELEPRFDPFLIERLLRHSYELHVKELEKLLERAIAWSMGDRIALTAEVEKDLIENSTPLTQLVLEPISRRAMLACIHKHDGNLTQAARELGLPSRFSLYRLLKKYGIDINEARER